MKLQEKVVIITGASGGIGLETANILAAEGAKLVLAARNQEKLAQVATRLTTPNIIVPTDITRQADCRALAQAAVDAFGRIDILVNNAGDGPPASLLETTEEIWDVTIDVCLKGTYLMSQAVVAVMLKQGSGAIVNISSVAGKAGVADRSAYCAAKWGVQGFSEALRAELGPQNIRIYTLCPGPVATPWWGHINAAQPAEVLGRMIQPPEVAEGVRWLLTQPERIQIDELVIKPSQNPWTG